MIKKNIFLFSGITVFVILFFAFTFFIADNAQAQIPNGTYLYYNQNAEDEPKKISDMEKLFQRISKYDVSFCSEQAEITVNEVLVTPVLVNEYYFKVNNQQVYGRKFNEEIINNKIPVAVIGRDLALQLFFNANAVGHKIKINGREYVIIGIVDENSNLINKLSGDGKNRIYIPYTAFDNYKQCNADKILYGNKSLSAPIIEQMNLSQYYSVDFSEKIKVIDSFKHIILLVLFVSFAVLVLKILYSFEKKIVIDVKTDLKEHYFIQSLKTMPVKYMMIFLILLSVPLLLIIFFSNDFSIYIPLKYMPNDNLFDISHYVEKIVENAREIHTYSLVGNTYLINLYNRTFYSLIFSTTLLLVFIVLEVSFIYVKIKGKFLKKYFAK